MQKYCRVRRYIGLLFLYMRTIKINLPSQWVLPLAILFLFILLLIVELPMLAFTKGMLIYPQGAGYIRMAIAKNLAFSQTWGLSPHEFSSASSSVLYPIILAACFKILGLQTVVPFVINLIGGVLFLKVLYEWLKRQTITPFSLLLILLFIIYVIPLHIMITLGMEATLEILFSFLFIFKFCEWMSVQNGKFPRVLYFYGAVMVTIRYEGLFIICIACLALLIRRKWGFSAMLGIIASLPLLVFGIYSLRQGGYFIPQSIIIKQFPLPFDGLNIRNFFANEVINHLLYPYPTRGAIAGSRLLIIPPFVYWLYIDFFRRNPLYRYIMLFSLCLAVMHLIFSSATLFYRYEAYLIPCNLIVPCVTIAKNGLSFLEGRPSSAKWILGWAGIFLFYPFFSRTWESFEDVSLGYKHEYLQNYQAARFIGAYYNGRTVVMDELGMAAFLGDGKQLDINEGIAYMDVARSKIEGYHPLEYQDFLINKEKPVVALISDRNYHPWLRRKWKKVGTWHTRYRIVLRDAELDIYAVDSSSASTLRKNLETFQASLPDEVKVVYE